MKSQAKYPPPIKSQAKVSSVMKSRARQIIKPTPKSKTKDRDKALIIQLASLLEEA